MTGLMEGKRGLIMGLANDKSLAWGIAKRLSEHGAELAFSYQGEALEKRVRPLAESLGSDFLIDCDVADMDALETAFVKGCQERGKAVIEKRGLSSAFSAANGALDHVKSMLKATAANDWVSMATVSKGEYGVPAGLVFGYPCRSDGKGKLTVVEGVKLDAFGQEKFKKTLQELQEERDAVKELLPS